jgi:Amt family ammonium transporter
VNGWGAMSLGVIAATLVYFALNYLSRMRPFRNVDDTLGVIYTHGFAGLAGGLLVGIFADPGMLTYYGKGVTGAQGLLYTGSFKLLKWQVFAGAWVIVFSSVATFILLKLVGLIVPLRMSQENMEIGDVAEHGHEVYPSDVPSLGFPSGTPELAGSASSPASALA